MGNITTNPAVNCNSCLFIILLICRGCGAKPTGISNDGAIIQKPHSKHPSYDLAGWEHVNKSCASRDCDEHVNLRHLREMALQMDASIDPCDDFHGYACSRWQSRHGTEKTMMAVGEKQLIQKFQQIFDGSHREEERDDVVFQKLQQYYAACLESESAEKATWRAYMEAMRSLGHLRGSDSSHWLQTLGELNQYIHTRFFISVHVSRLNSSLFMLNVEPHSPQERAELTADIYQLLRHFNYTNSSLLQLQESFKNLEVDLENILNSSCVNRVQDENYDCDLEEWLTWQELKNLNGSAIAWDVLLAPYPLSSSDLISVDNRAALEAIKQYLDAANAELLFLYSITRFLQSLQSHSYNIVKDGAGSMSCLRHMRKTFSLPMNYVYDKFHYGHDIRSISDPIIESIFSQLKQQFALIIESNRMQLPAEALKYLKMKLLTLQLNIGNLPKNVSQEFYHTYIEDLTLSNNFYLNHLNALKHLHHHRRQLASPANAQPWLSFNLHLPEFMDAMDNTAYYYCAANLIVLPFAYLQLPFYDHSFWPSLLYGDLANTLGHELIHAFDSTFLFYDHGGNYNDQESLQIRNNPDFMSNLACLNQQPTKFLSERIADISGTHLALKTFARDPMFLKRNGKLFFLQFAQFFCGAAEEAEFAKDDPMHDTDSARLRYTVAHMPEFAEVFDCPVGSAMNPVEKCQLWQ